MNWKFTCFVLIILIMLYFAVDEWQQYLSAKDRLGKNSSLFYIGYFLVIAILAVYSAWKAW